MGRQTFGKFLASAMMAAFAVVSCTAPASAQWPNRPNEEKLEFGYDVAEDMDLFVEHRTPAGEEPVRGSFFVTEGRIFMLGTIQGAGEDFDPKASGSLGAWFCKGTFLVRGSEFDKAEMAVFSDQLYLLPSPSQSIATTGMEGNGTIVRPVVGGTGPFAGYVGEQRQQFLGFNKTGGVNIRVTFILRKAS